MGEAIETASLVLAAMGLIAAVVAVVSGQHAVMALGVLLDFLLAAGLLRLGAIATWTAIATAALVALTRHIVSAGIGRADQTLHTRRRRGT
ncbi:MAG: hypothetical protein M3510_10345 [Actinomycetota bacterium]|nr:hypothetical protein [Actinomycetota bacterium]